MKLTGNNLVIVNILATYVRIVFSAGLMLFSTRWVLQALGKEDFGLYSVVGGLIVFILFIRMVTASSSQRFFAYTLGQGSKIEIQKWFNFSLSVHFILALVLVLVGIPFGLFFIDNILLIPLEKIRTCHAIYYLSIVASCVSVMTTSSYAVLVANQRIFELSGWETLRGVLVFVFSWYLLRFDGDILLMYASGMVIINLSINLIQYIRVRILYPECKIVLNQWFEKEKLTKFLGFSWWLSFASFCLMLRNQGIAILINVFYGAGANAALGVANQVNSQVSSISTAVYGAIAPEMTTSEGRADRGRVKMLSIRCSKFITLITLFWFIPLFVEMKYVLSLWLTEVPEHTLSFCRIVLIAGFIDKITIGQVGAMHSIGKIGRFEGSVGILYALVLPLAWLLLKYGYSAETALSSMIVMVVFITIGRLFWVKKLVGIDYVVWIQGVLLKGAVCSILPFTIAFYITNNVSESFFRILLTTGMNIFMLLIIIWFYVLDDQEKEFTKRKFKMKI